MIGEGYSLYESTETMRLAWSSPELPGAAKAFCYAALVFLPALFLLRRRAAEFSARRLNLAPTPRQIGLAAPILSVMAALFLYFGGRAETLVRWDLTEEGVAVKSLNGESALRWAEVAAVKFDDRDPKPREAALILEAADGKRVWLLLGWLQDGHRERVLAWIKERVPETVKF